jgi:thiamine pyrophosphate-dependent acetolactate synthase large subunit-like protein
MASERGKAAAQDQLDPRGLENIESPLAVEISANVQWGSDAAARMLRTLDIKYITVNPGASFRGLHDSIVNHIGNRDPQMLLCLNEDHVVSIAHGYAKATDTPMACVLHSNVGLMHGSMAIFNAWCDRMPILVMGATGPSDAHKRRPWIDWIHTMKDQGALVRSFTKWDDEPHSLEALIEALLRGYQLAISEPCGPVYICLDAALQEQKLDHELNLPEAARYRPPAAPQAPEVAVFQVGEMLVKASRPLFLFGRGSRKQSDWDARVRLAEMAGASVLTSVRERSVFPTEHGLHVGQPFYWANQVTKEIIRNADVIVSFDWVDLNGLLLQVLKQTHRIQAKIVHVSLDSTLHNGASMDYFGVPPVDVPIMASPDAFAGQLLAVLDQRLNGRRLWDGVSRNPFTPGEYSERHKNEIAPRDIEVALAKIRGDQKFTLAHVTIGWAGDAYTYRDPLDFLGHDGGAGLAAGPGLTVGAALAFKDSGRPVISVLGDGDFLQGAMALWTASHYGLPALFIVSNNRSNFNDEIHQETVAKMRGRPKENRWIGQRIDDPPVDIAMLARSQGVEAEGPITTVPALEQAIMRGLEAVRKRNPYVIDAVVIPGYFTPPLSRGE